MDGSKVGALAQQSGQVNMSTVSDELYDLEREKFALKRKLDVMMEDEVKPLREEIRVYEQRILAVVTGEDRDQGLLELEG